MLQSRLTAKSLCRPRVIDLAEPASRADLVFAHDMEVLSHPPPSFSWAAYLKWNPQLDALGIRTEDQAREHFMASGTDRDVVYQDFELTLRYTACGGLMNQHYCHLSALTLAHLSGAQRVVFPPLQERSSFNQRYHQDPLKNEQTWTYTDASSVWDVAAIQREVQSVHPHAVHISADRLML